MFFFTKIERVHLYIQEKEVWKFWLENYEAAAVNSFQLKSVVVPTQHYLFDLHCNR